MYSGEATQKLHKAHKRKKHKKQKKRSALQELQGSLRKSAFENDDEADLGLKLKIKLGHQQNEDIGFTDCASWNPISSTYDPSEHVLPPEMIMPLIYQPASEGKTSSDSDDDEEAWIQALESGRLDEVDDELKKLRNPTFMTARQKALYESKNLKEERPQQVVSLPEPETETEEMKEKRLLKAKKRKQQAEEKKEKDKKRTIERLLKKSDAKVKGSKKHKKTDTPKVTYIANLLGSSLSFPPGKEYPYPPQVTKSYPVMKLCSVEGCNKPKKYSCSTTGASLCSLECYKKNLELHNMT